MVDALNRTSAMSAERTERRVARWVAAVFVGSNVYYFHRYAFRYSNSGTSPTYLDTPVLWQSGKFVLMFVAALAAWLSVWWTLRTRRRHPWAVWRDVEFNPTGGFVPIVAGIVGYGAIITAFAAVPPSDHLGDVVGTWFFLPVVLLIAAAPLGRPSFVVYGWAGAWLVAYHVAFSAVQLVAFAAFDRLPALAYRNGLTRFGGGLDDPNGFGVMVILPILLGVSMWASWSRRWLAGCVLVVLGLLLFLTLSFSAIVGCVVGFVALALVTRRLRLLGVVGATLAIGVAVGSTWSYTRGVVSEKMDSARSRFDFGGSDSESGGGVVDFFRDADVTSVLFGAADAGHWSENSYLLLLVDFGVVGLGLVVAAGGVALHRGWATIRAARAAAVPEVARLYEGLLAFLVAFAVASLGVPYFRVFPVNMLFWIVAALAAMGPNIARLGDDASVVVKRL